jgi:glycosyltransferase involved in cell wall biosynthesis
VGFAAYASFFLLFVLGVRLATLLLNLIRFDHWAAILRRKRARPPRVLFLASFFPGNAGFEQRVRAWCSILAQDGFDARWRHAIGGETFTKLLATGWIVEFQIRFAVVRSWQCLQAALADAVIVERELLVYNDYGGVFLERFLLALNPRVALDFDDDIGAAKREPSKPSTFARLMLANGRKFHDTLRTYPSFVAGSEYLASLVPPDRAAVVVVPTCIDVARYGRKEYSGHVDPVTFGWIGGNQNLRYLDIIVPALRAIARDRPCRLLVISGRPYECGGAIEVENRPWTYQTETEDLLNIDIGLMPLPQTLIAKGKCGYKLLQYMASSLVGVASDVGMNREIVTDGTDGFLVRREQDWEEVLRHVLSRSGSFEDIGRSARRRVEAAYSFEAVRERYVDFVARLVPRSGHEA